ncbi:MAG: hypothetical protein WEB58_23835 [Planctomycetaceae bacterium]
MTLSSRLIRRIVAPAWARWERSPYLKHYRRLLKTQFDNPETIAARQWAAIEGLMRHAVATSPFYAARFANAGLTSAAIRGFDDFRRIPCLTKHDLRQHGREMLSSHYDPRDLRIKKTSGSTGVSVEILVDEDAMQFKRGCTLRSDEWTGWRLGERVGMVWGNPEYVKRGWRGRLRNTLLERAVYLDTLKMDERAMQTFLEKIRELRPTLFFGHAHSLYLFAEYAGSHGGPGYRPRGIISSAMVLHQFQREAIERVFGCQVTNRYGCEEVSLIACECEEHRGLHVNSDGVYVEVIGARGEPCAVGEPGSLVVTDLSNRAMPILRYKVGDVGVLSYRRCPCGRGLPLLEKLEGREADYVLTPDGQLISGISLTENFAMLVPGIEQLQIVQEQIDDIRFRIVKGADYGAASVAKVGELTRERFGDNVRYEIEYVDAIPQEPSGKYRFCISNVANPFLSNHEPAPVRTSST